MKKCQYTCIPTFNFHSILEAFNHHLRCRIFVHKCGKHNIKYWFCERSNMIMMSLILVASQNIFTIIPNNCTFVQYMSLSGNTRYIIMTMALVFCLLCLLPVNPSAAELLSEHFQKYIFFHVKWLLGKHYICYIILYITYIHYLHLKFLFSPFKKNIYIANSY